MSKRHVDIDLSRIESRLRVIWHSLGHHAGVVRPGDEDELMPCPESSTKLLHSLWGLLGEVLQEVEDLGRDTTENDGPTGEGPIGPLPPGLLDTVGPGPAEVV